MRHSLFLCSLLVSAASALGQASERYELREAWLQLARFQARHGYLDEARTSLDTVSKGEPGPLVAEEIRRLRERIVERVLLRERLEKALREVDALSTDASRWSELAFVQLPRSSLFQMTQTASQCAGCLCRSV